ncbi:competence/damage-inducible protein A [Clostridium cochlearium]|jgi:nicotinamide-nucleotide amidase|uniref:Putative competence-damage inducible protein n=1 Tax=Clostridium cochlearium TaxID=1494 RepID=A0A239Z2B4_CLOCO|nr:competence/damage-inducible protein A [Clostridium cochlearium]MBE6065929.1 competence/damage-inducible protein A [Clostridium cochlearium]MBU5269778.1 competence/damage-inducible protein A [Clostridium cochlearium]MDU1443632.1 competence/damage-inducible protein A [Clostridium cochlearium]SDL37687.1 competence/damage-inducible protein cinA [Clostridium cochlearium]SNV65469.1 competence damage-inducible protein A [Clostridium cochlearium]
MNAEIIAVGTEILLGDIVNTNAQFLSKKLAQMGISVYHQSVVGDNSNRLKEELNESFKRSDIVITTGGLGPTKDDLTKEIGAEYFNKEMILNEESLETIKNYFKKQGRKLSKNNEKQAYFPKDSIILPNNFGTAPGCIIEENNKYLIMLPGPPREIIPMFEQHVVPYLKKFNEGVLISKVLKICGMGESQVVTEINHLIENQTNPTVAPYAKENEVTLRLTAKASNEEDALSLIAPLEKEIKDILGDNIYGTDSDTLEGVIGNFLIENNLSIATAESCTGGLLCGRLVNYPGISKCLVEGIVTYSNDSKMNRIGVKKETLENFGAVSEETALEMAKGVAKTSGADIGISTTGIAGPSGGTDEKPIGLVYIGYYIQGKSFAKRFVFPGNRESIRNRTVTVALDYLRKNLI